MKYFLQLCLLPLDLTMAMLNLLAALPAVVVARIRRGHDDTALFFVPDASLENIHKKYGTLNVYLQDNPGCFRRVFRFIWGRQNVRLNLAEGFDVTECDMRMVFVLRHAAATAVRMLWTIALRRVGVLQARDPFFTGTFIWAIARLTGRPFSISLHADNDLMYRVGGAGSAPTVCGSRRLAKRIERFVLDRADMVFPISEYLAGTVAAGVPREKIRVIPHGIDMTPFRENDAPLPPELHLPPDKPVVSFVGRFSRQIFVDDIFAVLTELAAQRDDFVGVMAGDGAERPRLAELLAARPEIKGRIVLPGFLDKKKVVALRRASRVAVCLIGGFSLIEACAAGCVPIAYDLEWHAELVRNGENGFLIENGRIDLVREAIAYLLDHPADATRMGERARQRAIERHDIVRTNAIKCAAYRDLLGMDTGR